MHLNHEHVGVDTLAGNRNLAGAVMTAHGIVRELLDTINELRASEEELEAEARKRCRRENDPRYEVTCAPGTNVAGVYKEQYARQLAFEAHLREGDSERRARSRSKDRGEDDDTLIGFRYKGRKVEPRFSAPAPSSRVRFEPLDA